MFGLFALFAAIIIGYDLYSGNGKLTISSKGYCIFYNQYSYTTAWIKDFQHLVNKVAQLSLFVVFLFFYFKEHNTVAPLKDCKASQNVSKKLLKIAIAMGAIVGIARII